jgi:pimeloyl-ACP methyl ester carboxylesterase
LRESVAELLGIPMPSGTGIDVYSGVARASGRIWASRHRSTAGPARTAVVVVHPASNFLGHYLLGPLAAHGVDAIGLCTRYIGNDTSLILENCVLDIGAAVAHLRADGYTTIVLVGNSGGGGLAALYQSQATSPTITSTPAGDPPDLTAADLPEVDGVVFLMAHPGRAAVFTDWLDPAIRREDQPFERDPALDMFDAGNGPPYSAEFLARYRAGQLERSARITRWVRQQLAMLDDRPGGISGIPGIRDLPFSVHGTVADPRFLDLSIDPSDREPTTPWGPPALANYSPVSLGHQTTLRSWLSQWSIDESNGDGPRHAARLTCAVRVIYGSADEVCFPAYARSLYSAIGTASGSLRRIDGATHYFAGRPDLVDDVAGDIVAWSKEALS